MSETTRNSEQMLMPRHARALFAAAALGLLSLGACHGDAAPSGSPPPAPVAAGDAGQASVDKAIRDSGLVTRRNACDVLTREDAEAAVGQPLAHTTTKNIALGMCDHTTEDFSAGASITVGTWDSMKQAATSGRKPPDAIADVGDEALNLNGSNGSNLYVRKGAEGFLLTLNGPAIDPLPDHGLEAEKVLARKVLAKF